MVLSGLMVGHFNETHLRFLFQSSELSHRFRIRSALADNRIFFFQTLMKSRCCKYNFSLIEVTESTFFHSFSHHYYLFPFFSEKKYPQCFSKVTTCLWPNSSPSSVHNLVLLILFSFALQYFPLQELFPLSLSLTEKNKNKNPLMTPTASRLKSEFFSTRIKPFIFHSQCAHPGQVQSQVSSLFLM